MQLVGQALFQGEHFQFLAGGEPVIAGQVLVALDLVAKQFESLIERIVVPLFGLDQDPVHVEDYCLNHC
ncbi:hypothetical protein FQZ97_1259850 [compost metagenome]